MWLLSLFVSSFVIGMDDMIIAGLLPSISGDLDVSESAAGQLVTVFSLSYAIGTPLMAVATARLAPRAVLITALTVFASVNVLAAAAPTFWSLMGLRVVAALAAATITPLSYWIASELAPEHNRGRYLGVVTSGLTVSLIVGVPTGTWIGGAFDWRQTFLLVAIISLIALLSVAKSIPTMSSGAQLNLRQRLEPLRSPAIGLTITGLVVSGAGGMMTYVYLAPIGEHVADVGTTQLALLIAVFGVLGVLGTTFGGTVADRFSTETAMRLTFGGTALAALGMLILTLLAPAPYVILVIALAIYGLFVWSVNPPIQVRLLGLAGHSSAAVLALNMSALYAGFTAAGAVGGTALEVFGVEGLATASCGLLTVGIGIFTWSFRKERTLCVSES